MGSLFAFFEKIYRINYIFFLYHQKVDISTNIKLTDLFKRHVICTSEVLIENYSFFVIRSTQGEKTNILNKTAWFGHKKVS